MSPVADAAPLHCVSGAVVFQVLWFRCCGKYLVFVQPQKNLESISEQLRIPGSKSLGPIGQVS